MSKEHLRKYAKEYYNKNREEQLIRAAEEIMCECGIETKRGTIYKHRKSQKHIERMAEINKNRKAEEFDSLMQKYNDLKAKLKELGE